MTSGRRATLITDASYCPRTRAAGYGFWLASDLGKLGGGGPFQTLLRDNHEAEMKAVCNAVAVGIKEGLLQRDFFVLIQIDSSTAIEFFTKNSKQLQDVHREARDLLWQMFRDNHIRSAFRHVKGHSVVRDARSLSNRHCDRIAYRYMKEMRQEIDKNDGLHSGA